MNWFKNIMIACANWRSILFGKIASLGFDGWFYIFLIIVLVMLMSLILPMFTVVLFSGCILWFVEFVKFQFNSLMGKSYKTHKKPIICGFVGAAIGTLFSYLLSIPHEIFWF